MDERYMAPTETIDSDHPLVIEFAQRVTEPLDSLNPRDRAVALYYAVRDQIWYDPYSPFFLQEHYRASHIIDIGRGYCVSKAVLLCALARCSGIAARLGFADVRNHLTTRQLRDFMGTDLFVYHGYTELFIDGRWVIATPAFNKELCRRHHVAPLEFDGFGDSLFQPFNEKKEKFMDYVTYHGSHADLPLEEIVGAWKGAYGKTRVEKWIELFKDNNKLPSRNFYKEEVLLE